MYLIFDTETTGIPHNKTAPLTDLDNWPRLVQLAWQLHNNKGHLLSQHNYIIKPEGFDIPFKAEQVHGISTRRAEQEGHPIAEVLKAFAHDLETTQVLIGHNIVFDINIIGAEYLRQSIDPASLMKFPRIDTGVSSTAFCQLAGGQGGKLKMPRLGELYEILFGEELRDAHDAAYDVDATARAFFALIGKEVITPFDDTPLNTITYERPSLKAGNNEKREGAKTQDFSHQVKKNMMTDLPFCHLHTHSQFSVLQATPSVSALVAMAKKHRMPALALTDLGNMYGAFKFVTEASNHGIKAIVGCEYFVSEDRKKLKFTKDNPDRRYNQVLLAKNKTGYLNLARLSSLGFTEGLYGLYPRIDKELIGQFREGLMASTGGLSSEVPYLILHVGERQAEEAFRWWHELFQADFYVEINRHDLPEENRVNETLLRFCEKYGVKYFAANECYYLQKEESNAHDVLLCIKEGEFQSTPIGSGRGYRYGLPNKEFYFKSQEEMKSLFSDLPKAFETIAEIVEKVEAYDLRQDVLLPKFLIPEGFATENDYLRHLTYEGAKKRYSEITQEIRARLDFELETIRKTGYPGYFLIVQDFTNKAREMGVAVGPGRGSAAGSAVAYCTGITNVDPIAYDLLFERFLNPDRVSLPDIDIDFDDEGREKVLQYVIQKYGHKQVAQIITYGTMAAKSAIRDCARVMELPLSEANNLAKLVPERPGTTLDKAFEEVKELDEIRKGADLRAQVLNQAVILEGSLRNTGTHACGVIITPDELTSLVPVATARDSDMLVTQFDNSVVEGAGMLKMDFLGLTTLTIIKTTLKNIRDRHNVDIDIDTIPLNDQKTFQLYQRGETTGTFQFESDGMQSYLKALKPDKLEDLIAMNALYRPGPMEYIPNFIARKHGREPIRYDLPVMEEYLKDTYGITVYQEQVMLLSQKLADFSKGDADVLRKAMGKKQKEVLDKMKDKFIAGCKKNGHDERVAEKIWKDWEAFAQYAFNKSHSTCYSLVAYQTAYLKANYPAEYMAAVLTHAQHNLDKVTFFIEECRRQGIEVLGPHLNESGIYFAVNEKGEIRFGLGAIKGAGEAAVEAIIEERQKHGPFKDLFDFVLRTNQRAVNKKTLECLALSGALDCFTEFHRRQFVFAKEGDITLTEKLTRYAAKMQQELLSAQVSLFGGSSGTAMPLPKVEPLAPFSELEKLHFEKEVVGVYISGHPLDNFRFELDSFCNIRLDQLVDLGALEGREIKVGGIVSAVEHRLTKTGKPFGKMVLEDFGGRFEFTLWSEDYLKFKAFLMPGLFLFVEGSVVKKNWGDQSVELKIKQIDLLNDLGLKRTKGLQLKVEIAKVNDQMIDRIEAVCAEYAGTCPLYLKLADEEKNIHLELLSRKFRIKPVNAMVDKIRKIPDLQVEVVY